MSLTREDSSRRFESESILTRSEAKSPSDYFLLRRDDFVISFPRSYHISTILACDCHLRDMINVPLHSSLQDMIFVASLAAISAEFACLPVARVACIRCTSYRFNDT
jgi:hypothetical protein